MMSRQLTGGFPTYKIQDGVSVILEGLVASRGPRTWSPGPLIENIELSEIAL